MKFKEYIQESEHLKKAEQAVLAGDYESAAKHLSNHLPGKSRVKDAFAAKLKLAINNQKKRTS